MTPMKLSRFFIPSSPYLNFSQTYIAKLNATSPTMSAFGVPLSLLSQYQDVIICTWHKLTFDINIAPHHYSLAQVPLSP